MSWYSDVLCHPLCCHSSDEQDYKSTFAGSLSLYVLLNGSVLCSVFLRSPLYLISHFAFPLCAALIIVFLWSALAFDTQAPKILAVLQINCISQQYSLSLSLSHCIFLYVLSCLSHGLQTGDGPKRSGGLSVP